jgi:hypothetical protein
METPGTGVETKAEEEVSGSRRNVFGIGFKAQICKILLKLRLQGHSPLPCQEALSALHLSSASSAMNACRINNKRDIIDPANQFDTL